MSSSEFIIAMYLVRGAAPQIRFSRRPVLAQHDELTLTMQLTRLAVANEEHGRLEVCTVLRQQALDWISHSGDHWLVDLDVARRRHEEISDLGLLGLHRPPGQFWPSERTNGSITKMAGFMLTLHSGTQLASEPTASGGGLQRPPHEYSRETTAFVAASRIQELAAASSSAYNTAQLCRLCREINVCIETGSHTAAAVLTRALLDHVPPIFGEQTFEAVANNRLRATEKRIAKRLSESLRDGANLALHRQIGPSSTEMTDAVLPNRADLDALLVAVLRFASERP